MNVPAWAWFVTIAGLVALLVVDLIVSDRKPHEISVAEAAKWVGVYVCCAIGFGVAVWLAWGSTRAGEFFVGYLTEYSLSVDNLFVFVVIMGAFGVRAKHQHKVLLVGIVMALVLRGLFILAGAALIGAFSWIFYLFGALL